jgi:hypothetical protein
LAVSCRPSSQAWQVEEFRKHNEEALAGLRLKKRNEVLNPRFSNGSKLATSGAAVKKPA